MTWYHDGLTLSGQVNSCRPLTEILDQDFPIQRRLINRERRDAIRACAVAMGDFGGTTRSGDLKPAKLDDPCVLRVIGSSWIDPAPTPNA